MTYPALHELMRSYLHQDYDLIGSIDDNVDQFLRDFDHLAPLLPDDVARLLASVADDDEIRITVEEMGCQLRPVGGTYRAWLQQIADRVRAKTGTADR
ncbi:contact-dependent growth inhibition system immunity protein [Nocardioides aquiterrae]|uniref:CdiI immunity protein domain-containing protein n=1 Tax=Nocardioides aquiterrae TaxID=203799 RepID=A0ABN1UCI9_9ACTN